MENSGESVYNSLLAKVQETEDLHQICEQMTNVPGRFRLQRKIQAELQFLRKLSNHPEKLKEEHLRSSNLFHLSAIVTCCSQMPGIVKILEPFNYVEEIEFPGEIHAAHKRVVVDVVCDYGGTWIKVVARNPRALLQSSLGAGKFGRRSIVEQVEDMKVCANQNPYMYSCPKIVVWFASGVARNLCVHLEEMGVTVLGTVMDDVDLVGDFHHVDNMRSSETETCSDTAGSSSSRVSFQLKNESQLSEPAVNHLSRNVKEKDFFDLNETYENVAFTDFNSVNVDFNSHCIPAGAILNLDVSTMIAQVSNLTNGFCNFHFQEEILTDQATRERQYPVRRVLDLLFTGHKLVCCQTAYKDFTEILSTVAGEQEKMRATEMLADITVVPDNPTQKTLALQTSSKVRDRSKLIFGTGDNLKAITVTANLGFVRAAQSQGIKFVALVHESRALTEQKEKTALPLVF